MIDIISRASFIRFNTNEEQGLTRSMLRRLYDLGQENKASFVYHEEDAEYCIWKNNYIWTEDESNAIVQKIKEICTGIDVGFSVELIGCGAPYEADDIPFEDMNIDKSMSILNDREIESLLSALSDGEYDKGALEQ